MVAPSMLKQARSLNFTFDTLQNVKTLTVREVAKKLKANVSSVRLWCARGKFPNAELESTPRGPVWQIPEDDLRGFEKKGPGRPITKPDTSTD